MKKFLVIFILITSVLYAPQVFGFGGCEENCQKCHSLNNEEVQQIFTKLQVPDAQALDIKMSPIGGLWEIVFENKGQRGLMYISFSKKYVMGGQIFEVDTIVNKTQERLQRAGSEKQRYVEVAGISTDKDLLMGQKDARYKVIVFTDPD